MFVKLEGKRCLVVGAGKVGEPKIGGAARHRRARPRDCSRGVRRVHEWANAGKITLELRRLYR